MTVEKLEFELIDFEDKTGEGNDKDGRFVGGWKTYKFKNIAGYEVESRFWSNNDNEEMDYAHAIASLVNEEIIDGDYMFARILSEQIAYSGKEVARMFKKRSETQTRKYWVKWAKDLKEKAMELAKRRPEDDVVKHYVEYARQGKYDKAEAIAVSNGYDIRLVSTMFHQITDRGTGMAKAHFYYQKSKSHHVSDEYYCDELGFYNYDSAQMSTDEYIIEFEKYSRDCLKNGKFNSLATEKSENGMDVLYVPIDFINYGTCRKIMRPKNSKRSPYVLA